MKIILISFLALLAPILIGILFGFLMKGVNKMKKIFFVLLVCCLVNVLMGCGYTVVRTLSPTEIHKSNVSYKDSGGSDISSLKLLGSECDFLGASSADGSATRNEEKGVAELRSSSDGLSTATYFFDFNQTESLKISVDYQGKGRAIVLYGKSSNDKVGLHPFSQQLLVS